MKLCFFVLSVLFFSKPLLSSELNENLDVKFLTMYRYTVDTVSDDSGFGFDLSGVKFTKKLDDNVSAVFFPYFANNSFFNNEDAINRNIFVLGIYEAYFRVENIGAGIGLWKLGAGEMPWYVVEKNYYQYRYVARPLAYYKIPDTAVGYGLFFNKSFFNKSLNVITGYHAGNGFGGEKDVDNSGAVSITASLYPMLNCDNSLKTLSLNVGINAQTKDTARSTYHALLGYKYSDAFTGSIEYLGAYGGTSDLNMKALGAVLSYTIYNPYAVFVRLDYSDDASSVNKIEKYFLSGISTKLFKDTLGLALSFAVTDPNDAPATAKVFALNSVYSF